MGRKFVIADPATCIGCKTCMAACFHRHDVPNDVAVPRLTLVTTCLLYTSHKTDGSKQQKRLRRSVEGEEANQNQNRAGEKRKQRCQQREVCLQSFYCLNLYP